MRFKQVLATVNENGVIKKHRFIGVLKMEDDGKELKIYTSPTYCWIYNPKDIITIIII